MVKSDGEATSWWDVIDGRLQWILGSALMLDVIYQAVGQSGGKALALSAIVSAVYLGLIWAKRSLPPRAHLWIGSIIMVCAISVYGHDALHLQTEAFVWPMFWMLGAIAMWRRPWIFVLAGVCLALGAYLTYNGSVQWGDLAGMAGLFAAVRVGRLRRQTQREMERHLVELRRTHTELSQAHAELEQASVQSIQYAALAERARIARDVHDVVGHNLTTLIVQLQALQYMLPDDPAAAARTVPVMLQVARRGMDEIRSTVRDLAMDDSGLGLVALRGLISQMEEAAGVRIEFVTSTDWSDWPMGLNVVLYRVVQECLTNVMKYARATRVLVNVVEMENWLQVEVADDGEYVGHPVIQPGFGMKGMMERCEAVGGTCQFGVNEPHGLKVHVRLPLQADGAGA